jgi:hypothetical protein
LKLAEALDGESKGWVEKCPWNGGDSPCVFKKIMILAGFPEVSDLGKVLNPVAVGLSGGRVIKEGNRPHGAEFDAEGPLFLQAKVAGG